MFFSLNMKIEEEDHFFTSINVWQIHRVDFKTQVENPKVKFYDVIYPVIYLPNPEYTFSKSSSELIEKQTNKLLCSAIYLKI